MIEFREPEIGDKAWVEACFHASGNQGCEYSFATLFLWSDTYHQQVAAMDGYVLERMQGSRGCGYLFPAGSGPLEPVLTALEQDAAERGEPCRFFCVTPEQAGLLEEIRPGRYRLEPDRDGWDYLYDVDRLADLAGTSVRRAGPAAQDTPGGTARGQSEVITVENLGECAAMDLEWNRLYRTENGDAEKEAQTRLDERHAMSKAFAFYEQLGLVGLLIRCQGQVVAFTMGSLINPETVDVHFEKAYGEIQGAYPIINREFARWIRDHQPQVRWLNREDDMGLEGLRRSKNSYYPDRMVEKYLAVRM